MAGTIPVLMAMAGGARGEGVESPPRSEFTAGAAAQEPGERSQERLSLAGLVIGVWAMLPPWVGPKLAGIPVKREVVDHIVPGAAVVALSALFLVLVRRGRRPAADALVAGMVILLGGFWMTATHVALVRQVLHRTAPIPSVLHHTLPGLAVAGLGLMWTARYWNTASG